MRCVKANEGCLGSPSFRDAWPSQMELPYRLIAAVGSSEDNFRQWSRISPDAKTRCFGVQEAFRGVNEGYDPRSKKMVKWMLAGLFLATLVLAACVSNVPPNSPPGTPCYWTGSLHSWPRMVSGKVR
jgi:hypothetical protein